MRRDVRHPKALVLTGFVAALALAAGALLLARGLPEWLPSHSAADEQALRALQMLRALTERGISYEEYTTRVEAVRVDVEQALRSAAPHDDDVRRQLELAMQYYVAAGWAWRVTRMSPRESSWSTLTRRLPDDPELALCPAVRVALAQADKERNHQDTLAVEALNVSAFWTCAGDRVARAERLAQTGRW